MTEVHAALTGVRVRHLCAFGFVHKGCVCFLNIISHGHVLITLERHSCLPAGEEICLCNTCSLVQYVISRLIEWVSMRQARFIDNLCIHIYIYLQIGKFYSLLNPTLAPRTFLLSYYLVWPLYAFFRCLYSLYVVGFSEYHNAVVDLICLPF